MLLLVIPIVWLALIAFVVILCRMAARADAALISSVQPAPRNYSHPSHGELATTRVRRRRYAASPAGAPRLSRSAVTRFPR
jgi:hypothetical protein